MADPQFSSGFYSAIEQVYATMNTHINSSSIASHVMDAVLETVLYEFNNRQQAAEGVESALDVNPAVGQPGPIVRDATASVPIAPRSVMSASVVNNPSAVKQTAKGTKRMRVAATLKGEASAPLGESSRTQTDTSAPAAKRYRTRAPVKKEVVDDINSSINGSNGPVKSGSPYEPAPSTLLSSTRRLRGSGSSVPSLGAPLPDGTPNIISGLEPGIPMPSGRWKVIAPLVDKKAKYAIQGMFMNGAVAIDGRLACTVPRTKPCKLCVESGAGDKCRVLDQEHEHLLMADRCLSCHLHNWNCD